MNNEIAFLDAGSTYLELKNDIDHAVSRVLKSGWYILGKEVSDFEEKYSKYLGCSFSIGVGNGLDALTLSLQHHI